MAGQAQGVFSGTTSDGNSFQSIIPPNDKFYAIYGTTNVESGNSNDGNNRQQGDHDDHGHEHHD
jgi:hypothetical protein